MKLVGTAGVLFAAIIFVSGSSIHHKDDINEDRRMHPGVYRDPSRQLKQNPVYEDKHHWHKSAQDALTSKLKEKKIEKQAKNVIFFLGDGMSVPTVAAARILKGQKVDDLQWGEEASLHFESFPNIGVSKTFCTDSQVADSACSATAYLCGTKANEATMGLTASVFRKDCDGQNNEENHVSSILAWSQAVGKSTGIVTTARVTHASPGGAYAHIADRDWESDANVPDGVACEDIAKQLIFNSPGKDINVIMGGGRQKFLKEDTEDPEPNPVNGSTVYGQRKDGMNLPDEWKALHPNNSAYVTGRDGLRDVDTTSTTHLLGLFSYGHVSYAEAHDADDDPSLEEMTRVAIEILSKNPNGFFLFVEGGRIDHAHHDGYAHRALVETIEFDKAIAKADNMTSEDDTLLLVTADHAHVMTFAGYPERGVSILTTSGVAAEDGLSWPTLGYANGRGYRNHEFNEVTGKCERYDISADADSGQMEDTAYLTTATAPLDSETHGGDDVLIYSRGPFSHLLTGVQLQSYIPHILAYASCVGDFAKYCDENTSTTTLPTTGEPTSNTGGPTSSTDTPQSSTTSQLPTTTESSSSAAFASFYAIAIVAIVQILGKL